MGIDLLDLNVWVAICNPGHEHHDRALRYWAEESAEEVSFCEVTVLGLFRLLTNKTVMQGAPLTVRKALEIHEGFTQQAQVKYLPTTDASYDLYKQFIRSTRLSAHLLTDSWLAALATSHQARIVSFDRDFKKFDFLDALILA